MVKIGLICFGNNSGIGYQTKRLAEMIKPDRILYIDSTSFSKNKKQNTQWYSSFHGYKVDGFPTNYEIKTFLKGLTHVLCVENPLNYNLTSYAEKLGVKVYIQTNWEFNDFLDKKQLTLPYKFLMPSFWKIKEMEDIFGRDKVSYLPPPIDPNEFKEARETNFERKGRKRFLHVAGTVAAHDRNGTLDVIEAINHTREDFELVITSQHELPKEYMSSSSKIKYRIGGVGKPSDLYKDFDALILPRRYGGLCLPACEALMSALPVIMLDISPSKELLPKEWLINARKNNSFKTRTMIDVYQGNINSLAAKIDAFSMLDLQSEKIDAFEIGYNNFSESKLRGDYERLWM